MGKRRLYDFSVSELGVPKIMSPISYSITQGDCIANYVHDDEGIIFDIDSYADDEPNINRSVGILQKAGPREKIYFNPTNTHAAVITCGGLCPGLNDVIRAITRCLIQRYKVSRVTGLRFGYQGLMPENTSAPIALKPEVVENIHKIGGTILGTSRGGGDRTSDMVDMLEQMNINMLFIIGGDGTQRGALKIEREVKKRNLKIAIVGIPKTIDNDLRFVEKSFGFETAVSLAVGAAQSARAEAYSAPNGIGLVKVMGRDSGFIAAATAIASHEVDLVLVPEIPFELEGERGVFQYLERRIREQGSVVIVVAEGIGQDLLDTESKETDASGNRVLQDIGIYLKQRIQKWFAKKNMQINLKYIDPSYIIRSAVAVPTDAIYCARLGSNAVHAAMAGKTGILIGQVHSVAVHLPIGLTVETRNRIDPESNLWRDVLESTHQPLTMNSGDACSIKSLG